MYKILVIDDEQENCNLIQTYGTHLGHQVDILTNPLEVQTLLLNESYHLILLDVMMPEINGFDLVEELTQANSSKVIFVSALGTTSNRIKGLKLGAVDYITKPFSLEELFLKIDILLTPTEPVIDGYKFDHYRHLVTTPTQQIRLSNTLFNLLFELVNNPGETLSRDYLLKTVWGIDSSGYNRTVDTHILKLRKELKSESYKIVTVIGEGYKYEN